MEISSADWTQNIVTVDVRWERCVDDKGNNLLEFEAVTENARWPIAIVDTDRDSGTAGIALITGRSPHREAKSITVAGELSVVRGGKKESLGPVNLRL